MCARTTLTYLYPLNNPCRMTSKPAATTTCLLAMTTWRRPRTTTWNPRCVCLPCVCLDAHLYRLLPPPWTQTPPPNLSLFSFAIYSSTTTWKSLSLTTTLKKSSRAAAGCVCAACLSVCMCMYVRPIPHSHFAQRRTDPFPFFPFCYQLDDDIEEPELDVRASCLRLRV